MTSVSLAVAINFLCVHLKRCLIRLHTPAKQTVEITCILARTAQYALLTVELTNDCRPKKPPTRLKYLVLIAHHPPTVAVPLLLVAGPLRSLMNVSTNDLEASDQLP